MAEKSSKLKQVFNVLFPGSIEKRAIYTGPTTALGLPYYSQSSPISIETSLQLSAVYRCTEVISDAIASETWDHLEYTTAQGWKPNEFTPTAYLLNKEPNKLYSMYMLMKAAVARMLLWGNGYIEIIRDGSGNPIKLSIISIEVRRYIRNDDSSYYELGPEGDSRQVEDYNIIHIMAHTQNGLIGISVIHHALLALGLAVASEASAKGFFLSGANMAGILTAQGKMTPEKARDIKSSWSDAFDVSSGTPGGIAVMEAGLEFLPVNINPRDAQMLETRKFNVVEICRFFGVSPSKVFDDSNLTYNNIEALQLGFLTDTISPMNNNIEAEFNRKLLRPSMRKLNKLNLNIEGLLRANLDTKANYISKMFQVGGYTVNEVRAQAGNPAKEGGDEAYIQVNMQPVKKAEIQPEVIEDDNQKIKEDEK